MKLNYSAETKNLAWLSGSTASGSRSAPPTLPTVTVLAISFDAPGPLEIRMRTYFQVASNTLSTVLDGRSLSSAFGLVIIQPTAKLRFWRKIYYILPTKYLQLAILRFQFPPHPLLNGPRNIASSTRSRRQMAGLWFKLLIFSHILLTKSSPVLCS
jgi:hypothetical protein